ncbi:V-type proton ATPase subunit S1 isoform 1-T1 [Glossina fuscipes fuscipes]
MFFREHLSFTIGMNIVKINILIVLSFEIIVIRSDNVPVFIWNAKLEEKSALQAISTKEFENIINPLLPHNTVIIFLENQLTWRDFQCRLDGSTCFPFMESQPDKTYMTVNNPLGALQTYVVNDLNPNSEFNLPIDCQKGLKYVINLHSLSINEKETNFKLHDAIIRNITRQLNLCPVLYMYTTHPSSALQKVQARGKRVKRQVAVAKQLGNFSFVFNEKFAMIWEKFLLKEDDDPENIEIESVDVAAEVDETIVNLNVDEHFQNEIHFSSERGYHTLKYIQMDGVKYTTKPITFSKDISYACHVLYLYNKENTSHFVKLERFQFELFKKPMKKLRFSSAWHCVGYLTAPIIAGIISASILLGILSCGVVWIMNVGAVDRFDDPFGKSIVIITED